MSMTFIPQSCLIGINTSMLIREFSTAAGFAIFIANVKVRQKYYSQWIPVQISARNMHEARRALLAQYGPDAIITGMRQSK